MNLAGQKTCQRIQRFIVTSGLDGVQQRSWTLEWPQSSKSLRHGSIPGKKEKTSLLKRLPWRKLSRKLMPFLMRESQRIEHEMSWLFVIPCPTFSPRSTKGGGNCDYLTRRILLIDGSSQSVVETIRHRDERTNRRQPIRNFSLGMAMNQVATDCRSTINTGLHWRSRFIGKSSV